MIARATEWLATQGFVSLRSMIVFPSLERPPFCLHCKYAANDHCCIYDVLNLRLGPYSLHEALRLLDQIHLLFRV